MLGPAPVVVLPVIKVIQMAASQSPSVESTKTSKKLEKALTGIWEIWLSAQGHSKLLTEALALSPELQAKMRSYLFKEWADMPPASLLGYVNGWKAWCAWCRVEGINPFQPSRIHLVLYLDDARLSGATAARGKFNSLNWLTRHLELDMPLESAMVKDATRTSASHVEKQVPPMRISLWAVFTVLSTAENSVIKGVSLFRMMVLSGVLRPAHLQRSIFKRLLPRSIEGCCVAGKKKTDGKRRAFTWRAPRISILGSDIGKAAFDFAEEFSAGSNFFLPDTAPKGSGLEAMSWLSVPMDQGKIKKLAFKILLAVGVPEENTKQLRGLYAARRVLPTLAHRLKFSKGERLDVGSWSDPGLKMPQTYSEAGLDEQADLREELVLSASNALRILSSQWADPTPALELNMSFSEIWQFFPKQRTLKKKSCEFEVGVSWCSKMFPGLQVMCRDSGKEFVNTEGCSPVPSESSDSSDSSKSASDDEKDDLPPKTSGVHWQMSKGLKGCLHVNHSEDEWKTACGRSLYMAERGSGRESALSTGRPWSPRCWKALQDDTRAWWLGCQSTTGPD